MKEIRFDNIKTIEDAKNYLNQIDIENDNIEKIDIIVKLTNAGVSQEIINRLDDLWDKTMFLGKESVAVGRIITIKIMEFVEQNPDVAAGVAIGAAVALLAAQIPLIGSLLAPIAFALGLVGVYREGKRERGEEIEPGLKGIINDLIAIAKKFFKLIIETFKVIKERYSNNLQLQPVRIV